LAESLANLGISGAILWENVVGGLLIEAVTFFVTASIVRAPPPGRVLGVFITAAFLGSSTGQSGVC
jgi:hypothetical protein